MGSLSLSLSLSLSPISYPILHSHFRFSLHCLSSTSPSLLLTNPLSVCLSVCLPRLSVSVLHTGYRFTMQEGVSVSLSDAGRFLRRLPATHNSDSTQQLINFAKILTRFSDYRPVWPTCGSLELVSAFTR